MSGKILDAIFSNSIGQSRSWTDIDTSEPSHFEAAEAAIDRAILERRDAAHSMVETERRLASEDRRKELPDTRPPGSPDRRSGRDRRASFPNPAFGKRGKTD